MHPLADRYWFNSSQTILVTGAMGHLGRLVVQGLCEAGFAVRVLVPVGFDDFKRFPQRAILCEFSWENPDSLRQALRNCHRVVHLDEQSCSQDVESLRQHNIEKTRILLQQALAEDVPHFIHLSSQQAAYRHSTPYGHSKKIAEDVVRGSRLKWTLLRPTLVVGPHGSQEFRLLRWWVKHFRMLLLPQKGHVHLRPIHEFDLALAICKTVQAPLDRVARKTFALAGHDSMSLLALVDRMSGEAKLPERVILPIPDVVIKSVLTFFEKISRKHATLLSQSWTCFSQDSCPQTEEAFLDIGFSAHPFWGRMESPLNTKESNIHVVLPHQPQTPRTLQNTKA